MVRRNSQRQAFTLVELLVVIAIIGVLVSLLLPAVQAAREAARRSQCSNNLKQFGLAQHNYSDAYRSFSPGGFHFAGGVGSAANSTSWGPSWIVMSLPYIEQTNLYNLYDFKVHRSRETPNANVVGQRIPVVVCPSDGGNKEPCNTNGTATGASSATIFERGNYAANCGAGNAFSRSNFTQIPEERGPFNLGGSETGRWYAGKFADVEDGTSNTILLAEIVAGDRPGDIRGAWAYPPGVYISGGTPHYASPRVQIPPNGNALDDNLRDRPSRCSASNGDRYLRCLAEGSRAYQTARSKHPGIVQVCMADGSVRPIVNTINLTTWLRLLAQADRQVVGDF
jgi:prepilin-type N-terminal cleavage/methylation domain-containing protein